MPCIFWGRASFCFEERLVCPATRLSACQPLAFSNPFVRYAHHTSLVVWHRQGWTAAVFSRCPLPSPSLSRPPFGPRHSCLRSCLRSPFRGIAATPASGFLPPSLHPEPDRRGSSTVTADSTARPAFPNPCGPPSWTWPRSLPGHVELLDGQPVPLSVDAVHISEHEPTLVQSPAATTAPRCRQSTYCPAWGASTARKSNRRRRFACVLKSLGCRCRF